MAEIDDHELIRYVRRAYRSSTAPEPRARARLDERFRRMPRPRRRAMHLGWLARPVTLRLSPLAAVAAAALLVAVGVLAGRGLHSLSRAPGDGADAAGAGIVPAGTELVRFELAAPAAATVALVGDFNDWDPRATPMKRLAADGSWTVAVAVPSGRHVYAFIVDGERWVGDPSAARTADDDFGAPNAVIVVGVPEEAS